jgi:hypothetical protein
VNEKGLASGKRCQAFFAVLMKQKIPGRTITSKFRFAAILQPTGYPQGASQKLWLITWKPL